VIEKEEVKEVKKALMYTHHFLSFFHLSAFLEKNGPLQLSVVRVITEESGTMATLPSALQQGHFPFLSVFFLTFSVTTHMGPPAIKHLRAVSSHRPNRNER